MSSRQKNSSSLELAQTQLQSTIDKLHRANAGLERQATVLKSIQHQPRPRLAFQLLTEKDLQQLTQNRLTEDQTALPGLLGELRQQISKLQNEKKKLEIEARRQSSDLRQIAFSRDVETQHERRTVLEQLDSRRQNLSDDIRAAEETRERLAQTLEQLRQEQTDREEMFAEKEVEAEELQDAIATKQAKLSHLREQISQMNLFLQTCQADAAAKVEQAENMKPLADDIAGERQNLELVKVSLRQLRKQAGLLAAAIEQSKGSDLHDTVKANLQERLDNAKELSRKLQEKQATIQQTKEDLQSKFAKLLRATVPSSAEALCYQKIIEKLLDNHQGGEVLTLDNLKESSTKLQAQVLDELIAAKIVANNDNSYSLMPAA